MAKKIRVSVSQSQKKALVDFIQNHANLRKGKFSKQFTKKMAENLWKELTDKLNVMDGAKKDYKRWRKSWQDLRSAVKAKASKNITLSETERKIINLVGKTAVEGHPGIPETHVNRSCLSSTTTIGIDPITVANIVDLNYISDEVIPPSSTSQEDAVIVTNIDDNVDLQNIGEEEVISQDEITNQITNRVTVPKQRRIATQRFENTIRATEKLVNLFENKIKSKENYYAQKLQLLKLKLELDERVYVSKANDYESIVSYIN